MEKLENKVGVVGFKISKHRFYQTWYSMIHRCTNAKSPAYKHYGGRGITVCEEWLDKLVFLKWCDLTYPNIDGLSLDRIDNDKGYSPDNCRWATKQTQILNQRVSGRNTSGFVGITYNKKDKRWIATVGLDGKLEYIGSYTSKNKAVQARDQYITSWKLPHKLSTQY